MWASLERYRPSSVHRVWGRMAGWFQPEAAGNLFSSPCCSKDRACAEFHGVMPLSSIMLG